MISNGFLSIAFPDRSSIKKRNFCLSLEFLDVEEKRLIGRVYKNGNERTFVEEVIRRISRSGKTCRYSGIYFADPRFDPLIPRFHHYSFLSLYASFLLLFGY